MTIHGTPVPVESSAPFQPTRAQHIVLIYTFRKTHLLKTEEKRWLSGNIPSSGCWWFVTSCLGSFQKVVPSSFPLLGWNRFQAGSHHMSQADLELLTIYLAQSPNCQDNRSPAVSLPIPIFAATLNSRTIQKSKPSMRGIYVCAHAGVCPGQRTSAIISKGLDNFVKFFCWLETCQVG